MSFVLNNDRLGRYALSRGFDFVPNTVRLFAIRGAEIDTADPTGHSIRLVKNTLDLWNDTLGIWGKGLELFQGTIDPGAKYTLEPLNPEGAAHVLTIEEGGKPLRFKWGLHHGEYECLVQAEPFTVRRDKDRDGVGEATEPLQTGEFGIHVHHGGAQSHVGPWSAGCLVLKGGAEVGGQWRRLYQALKESQQTEFVMYPMDGRKLATFLGVVMP